MEQLVLLSQRDNVPKALFGMGQHALQQFLLLVPLDITGMEQIVFQLWQVFVQVDIFKKVILVYKKLQ